MENEPRPGTSGFFLRPMPTRESFQALRDAVPDLSGFEAYQVRFYGGGGIGDSARLDMLWHAEAKRAACSHGATVQWTSAESPKDAVWYFLRAGQRVMTG